MNISEKYWEIFKEFLKSQISKNTDIELCRKLQILDMTEIMTVRTQDKVHVSNEGRASVTYNAVLTGKFGSKKFSFSSEDKRNQLFDLIGTFTGMDIY